MYEILLLAIAFFVFYMLVFKSQFFSPIKYHRKKFLENYIRSQYGPFLIGEHYHASESFYQKIVEESKPYINSETRALDVGCATGRIVFEYEKLGAKSTGIDTDRHFIKFCNLVKNGKQDKVAFAPSSSRSLFVRGDIMRYPFKEESFTFISCINLIDRVPNPEILIKKLFNILMPGGIMLLVLAYDWRFSPAPKRFHTSDMKSFFSTDIWTIEKELFDIPYTIAWDTNTDIKYKCHLVIAKRKVI